MRLVTYEQNGSTRIGARLGDRVVDLCGADPGLPGDMRGLLEAGALERARAAAGKGSPSVALSGVKLRAPISNPEKVICIGLNYADHAAETGMPIPPEPVVFSKFASAIIGPGDPIRLPKTSTQPDYEAELVVVVGKLGRDIAESRAMDHVAGYCTGHDVSARDYQLHKPGGQWMLGKTFDTFAPLGPEIVTAEEVADPHVLDIRCELNGKTVQDSNTKQLIFRIPRLIAYLSHVFTLRPGDLIFTGTPPGVGMARKPPLWLKPGDRVLCEVEGVGRLENPVVGA